MGCAHSKGEEPGEFTGQLPGNSSKPVGEGELKEEGRSQVYVKR